MKFDLQKPVLDLKWVEWATNPGIANGVNGIVKINYSGLAGPLAVVDHYSLRWLENGIFHKELGPGGLYMPTEALTYYYEGNLTPPRDYWKIMCEKYKDTEHEGLCLSELLAIQ